MKGMPEACLKLRRHHSWRKRLASGEAPPPPGTPFLSFFPFASSPFCFCFFGRRGWRKGVGEEWLSAAASRRTVAASHRGRRRGSLGLLISNPKRRCFGLFFFFFKSKHPKTTSFGVPVFFFFNQNTPKRCRFGVPDFKKIKDMPKTTLFCVSGP